MPDVPDVLHNFSYYLMGIKKKMCPVLYFYADCISAPTRFWKSLLKVDKDKFKKVEGSVCEI